MAETRSEKEKEADRNSYFQNKISKQELTYLQLFLAVSYLFYFIFFKYTPTFLLQGVECWQAMHSADRSMFVMDMFIIVALLLYFYIKCTFKIKLLKQKAITQTEGKF